MQRRELFKVLGHLARTKGKEAAGKAGKTLVTKVARPLGERVAAAASKAAAKRGHEGVPDNLDEMLARLKELRANGDLSLEEFWRRRDEIFAAMRGKQGGQ